MGALEPNADAVIVGGGLAGLAAAVTLARAGRSVVVFERSQTPGGRARTKAERGFLLNLGPHALYRKGHGAAFLRELGVGFTGGVPGASGGYALHRGRLHTLPVGPFSLLTTGLLSPLAKLEAGRFLASLPRLDADALGGTTVTAWLERAFVRPEVRELIAALIRVTTYTHDPERLSAGAALRQLQLGQSGGVLYLDGGWQTLVEGLRRLAEEAGAHIVTRARVVAIEGDGAVEGARLSDGTLWRTRTAMLTGDPAQAAALVHGGAAPTLARWAGEAYPVAAACLDVALDRLPRPHARFALGIDGPLYLSVHSAVARLAPEGGALIHAARYLGPDAAEPRSVESELEGLLETLQPGWRRHVVHRRFLPRLVVSSAVVTAAGGGAPGRPGPEVPGVRGLYVAGDWVGSEGMLSDASLASARRAARAILAVEALRSGAAA